MRRGFSLLELIVVIVIAGFVLSLWVPRVSRALDYAAANGAADDVATAIATTRALAVARGTRLRLRLATDSLRFDTLGTADWGPFRAWPGPGARRVVLTATNSVVDFTPIGFAWGVSNTTVTLTRGSQVETVVMSRLGRVRRR